jgi:hypothetical protein
MSDRERYINLFDTQCDGCAHSFGCETIEKLIMFPGILPENVNLENEYYKCERFLDIRTLPQ